MRRVYLMKSHRFFPEMPRTWSRPLPPVPPRSVFRSSIVAIPALTVAAVLAGCASQPPAPATRQPAFYANLGEPGARLDGADAAQTINLYRQRHGLAALDLDPELTALASREATAMAGRDAPASADALRRSLASRGVSAPMVNMSAGYRTMAEAFSGWRDSPAHNAAMLNPRATRMGVAAASARPGSKYRVYWTLVTAGP